MNGEPKVVQPMLVQIDQDGKPSFIGGSIELNGVTYTLEAQRKEPASVEQPRSSDVAAGIPQERIAEIFDVPAWCLECECSGCLAK